MVVDIPDVVTYTNFGDHRLRGFWVAGGQICPSPIDFHRRPYNTLALPCERVMVKLQFLVLLDCIDCCFHSDGHLDIPMEYCPFSMDTDRMLMPVQSPLFVVQYLDYIQPYLITTYNYK